MKHVGILSLEVRHCFCSVNAETALLAPSLQYFCLCGVVCSSLINSTHNFVQYILNISHKKSLRKNAAVILPKYTGWPWAVSLTSLRIQKCSIKNTLEKAHPFCIIIFQLCIIQGLFLCCREILTLDTLDFQEAPHSSNM